MENRYLFKAKRKDNGEWVIGSLISMPYGGYMIDRVVDSRRFRVMINPSTICQCTGLKDKNNNLIWENDIAKFDVYYYEKLQSSTISQIKWCNELCALSLVVNDRGTRGTLGHLMDLNKEIEVIGNIFDNPELINKREKTYCKDDNDYER